MRSSRLLAGVLVAVFSVALVGNAPVHAVAAAVDPLATTVTGACSGGPGRMSVTAHPSAAGGYRVKVTARGLAGGSRWAVQVAQRGGDSGAGPNEFRRVAVDGKWTVATRFPAPADPEDDSYFVGFAQERRDGSHGCFVFNSPASPVAGLAQCNTRPRIVMSARERDDGSTLVHSLIVGVRRGSRWHLTLTATGAAGGQVLTFDDRAGRRGESVRSRVVITGVEDPRLRLVASNKDQGRCFIGVNPPNATTDAPLTQREVHRLNAFRA